MLFKIGFALSFMFEMKDFFIPSLPKINFKITNNVPTKEPTPSINQTYYPTSSPTVYPTSSPTVYPTSSPTAFPTSSPTAFPTSYTTISVSVPGSTYTTVVASTSSYAVGNYYTPSSKNPNAFVFNYDDGSYTDLYVPDNNGPSPPTNELAIPSPSSKYSTGTDIVGDTVFFDNAWRFSFSKNLKTGQTTQLHPNEYPGYPEASITSVDPINPQWRAGHYLKPGATIVNSFYTDGTTYIELKAPNPNPDNRPADYISYFAKGIYNGNVVGIIGDCCSGRQMSPQYKIGWFWNGKTFLEGGIRLPDSFGKFISCGANDIYGDYIVGNCDTTPFIYVISSKTYRVITSNIPSATISVFSVSVSELDEIIITGSYGFRGNDDTTVRGFRATLDKNFLIMLSGAIARSSKTHLRGISHE